MCIEEVWYINSIMLVPHLFLELVVDPPGSSTNTTTQPRLTITNSGSTYPQ